jgi:small conductance mechanosensitive channel
MKIKILNFIIITVVLLCLQFIYAEDSNIVNVTENKYIENWMPEKMIIMMNKLQDINVKIDSLDEYSPQSSPDFKNLQKINQLVDELEFNKRKFKLLIDKYNLIEEEIFEFLLKYSEEGKNINKILSFLKHFKKRGDESLFLFQKTINGIALKIERLNRDILQIQIKTKTDALNAENKDKNPKDWDTMTISERIQRLRNDYVKLKKELRLEEDILKEQNKKESFQVSKIKEKKDEITELKVKAKKSKNITAKTIYLIKARVIKERLNGLEILKLNTIKAHTYLVNTKVETLNEKINKNVNEQKLLEKIRKKEIRDNLIKSIIIIIIALFIALLLIRLSKYISNNILKRIEKSEKYDAHKKQRYQTLSAVLLSFSKILIWTAAVFWTLGELNVDYGPFLVAAGGISLAIGFGAQSLVKDIVTGFFLLVEEQFALGDFVEINGDSGTVEKISLRTIRFRSLDGTVHIIPNGNISKVSNSTYKWSRAVVKIGVSYNENTDHVFKALKEVCNIVYNKHELKSKFLEEPAIQGILAFNDSSVMFRITAKTESGEQWGIEREINKTIKEVFDRENIEIPYNYINIVNVK